MCRERQQEFGVPLEKKKSRRAEGGTRARGRRWQQRKPGGDRGGGEVCQSADLFFFLLKQKKKKKEWEGGEGGGASHTEADGCFICGFNQCLSLSSAIGEHSVKGVLRNTLAFIIDRVIIFFSFSFSHIFIFFPVCLGFFSPPPWLNALALSSPPR